MSRRDWDLYRPKDIPPDLWAKTTQGQAGKVAAAAHDLIHPLLNLVRPAKLRRDLWLHHEVQHLKSVGLWPAPEKRDDAAQKDPNAV